MQHTSIITLACRVFNICMACLSLTVCHVYSIDRNLREVRDNALAEKDRAVQSEQHMTSRYEQVAQEYVF